MLAQIMVPNLEPFQTVSSQDLAHHNTYSKCYSCGGLYYIINFKGYNIKKILLQVYLGNAT